MRNMAGRGVVVTDERSKVLSLHGVLTLAANRGDVYALQETGGHGEHHHQSMRTGGGCCGALVTCLEFILAILFPVIWAVVVLVVHAVRRCLSWRRAAKRKRMGISRHGSSLRAISLPVGRPSQRSTWWEHFRRRSTKKKDQENKREESSVLEVKVKEGEVEEGTVARFQEGVRGRKNKNFRRQNTFDLNALLDAQKEGSKGQNDVLVHHSDALFYLHASRRHLEEHVSRTKYTDSVVKKASEMVDQRTLFRNGSSTWEHHGNDGAESDTDWETDESEVEKEEI